MTQTLLQLAETMKHDNSGTALQPEHDPIFCRRCKVEQWAREKAQEWLYQGGLIPDEGISDAYAQGFSVKARGCARELVGDER